jgi:hypothetical protein
MTPNAIASPFKKAGDCKVSFKLKDFEAPAESSIVFVVWLDIIALLIS